MDTVDYVGRKNDDGGLVGGEHMNACPQYERKMLKLGIIMRKY